MARNKKMVTSVSTTRTKTFGVWSPDTPNDQTQVQTVAVSPHQRRVPEQPQGLRRLLPRKKRKDPGVAEAEAFAASIDPSK